MVKKVKDGKLVVYPKQWPDTRVDKTEIDKDEPVTPHLGHEYRLTKKFSEQVTPPKPGARDTLGARLKRVGNVRRGVPVATTRVEETDMSHEDGKTFSQFVTEAAKRGRPRKLRPGEEADTLHLQDQLNKLTHPNHVEVHFKDGSKHRIPREHANMALHHLNSLKPIERADHAEHMAKSHNDFYHVLSKKSIPAKKGKITLAGPKLRKEEVEQIDEWGKSNKIAKQISGTHARLSKMSSISTPSLKGKGTQPKVQRLRTEGSDYAPLEAGATQKHPQEKTVAAKSKIKGGEKPAPARDKYLTKEALEIYEALSDEGKILFEKMSSEQLAKLVAAFPGKVKKGKYNAPRESEKTWPASKMKGSKWASTAGSINRKNQGYKK